LAIAAAVPFTGLAAFVFEFACTPESPAVPALILGMLDHAFKRCRITYTTGDWGR